MWLVLALATGVQVTLAIGVTGWISLKSGERSVRALVSELQREVADSSARSMEATLLLPQRVNQLNADLLDLGRLDPEDFDVLQRHFHRILGRHPSVGFVSYGLPDGGFIGVERTDAGPRAERSDTSDDGKDVFRIDAQGGRYGDPIDHVEGYRADQRPWFIAAVNAGRATWSEVYQFSSRAEVRLGVSAVRPHYDEDDNLMGVWGTDIVLAQLGRQLSTPRVRAGGRVFAIERDGLLIASNEIDPPFRILPNGQADRLRADQSGDPLTELAAIGLAQHLPNGLDTLTDPIDLVLDFEGDLAFVHAAPFVDRRGIDWVLVVALPRADFSGEIRQNTRRTLWLCVIALTISLLLAGGVARWLGQPILELSSAARALSRGEWDADLPRARTAEVSTLAESFSRMRDDLRTHRDALTQQAQDANEAREVAVAASRSKSVFLARMSHELRTPLNAILGYADLLRESEALSEQGGKDLDRITTAGRHLVTLISDVLDLTRIDAGHLELHLEESDGRRIVEAALAATEPQILASRNTLEVELADDLGRLSTDVAKARQCVVNLLANAAKFTEDGVVRLRVWGDENAMHFEVSDTGIGIAAKDLEQAFAPFSQLDGSPTRRRDGAGLGLAITREFAHALGGTVEVQSTPGKGSTFTLTLPRGSLLHPPGQVPPSP